MLLLKLSRRGSGNVLDYTVIFRKKMPRVTDPHVQRYEKTCIPWSKKNKYIQAVKVFWIDLCR